MLPWLGLPHTGLPSFGGGGAGRRVEDDYVAHAGVVAQSIRQDALADFERGWGEAAGRGRQHLRWSPCSGRLGPEGSSLAYLETICILTGGVTTQGQLTRRLADDPLACLAVPEVRLRPWRMADIDQIAQMTNDEYLRPWWWMAHDLRAWLRTEMSEERGPTRAVCLPDDDRALGRVAVRLPPFASEAVRCDAVQTSDQPAGELSYWLLPGARGRGLAFTAVTEMVKIAANAGLKSLVLDIERETLPRYASPSAWVQHGESQPEYTQTASATTGRWWSMCSPFDEFGTVCFPRATSSAVADRSGRPSPRSGEDHHLPPWRRRRVRASLIESRVIDVDRWQVPHLVLR